MLGEGKGEGVQVVVQRMALFIINPHEHETPGTILRHLPDLAEYLPRASISFVSASMERVRSPWACTTPFSF